MEFKKISIDYNNKFGILILQYGTDNNSFKS